jgi:hypothetical protein
MVAVVEDPHPELGSLVYANGRTWNRAVVGEHPDRVVADLLGYS